MTALPILLLISNADDALEVFDLLGATGFLRPALGVGKDDSLALFEQSQPDVVLIVAGSEHGDLASLTSAISSGHYGRPAPIVLIAAAKDEAFHASFAKDVVFDVFIKRPLDAQTLSEQIVKASQMASKARLEVAMDSALTDLKEGPGAGKEVEPQRGGGEIVPSLAMRTPMPFSSAREATYVLGAEGEEGMDLESELLLEDLQSDSRVSSKAVKHGSDVQEEQTGGDFARQLREKMSVMAERLFPGQSPSGDTVNISPGSAHTEIDLGSIAEEDVHVSYEKEELGTTHPRELKEQGAEVEGSWPRALPKAGLLEEEGNDVASVLGKLSHADFTGRTVFSRGSDSITVEFEEGAFVFASSGIVEYRMSDLLFREGKINASQLSECRALVDASGRRMGEVLVEKGYLKPRELLPAVRRHLEDLFYSLFAWNHGHFEVQDSPKMDERIRLSRHPAALLIEGIRRKYEWEQLKRYLGDEWTVVAAQSGEFSIALLQNIELSLEENQAQGGFDGKASLQTIAQKYHMDPLRVAQLAYAFICLRMAVVVTGKPDALTLPLLKTGQSQIGEAEIEIDKQRLLDKYKLVQCADYFQVLGVRADASAYEIRRAYEGAKNQYAEGGFSPVLQQEFHGLIREITEVIEEAYLILKNDKLRTSYKRNLG